MSVYDRFEMSSPSSSSSTKIIITVVILIVVVASLVGLGFLIWWLVRRSRSSPTPSVSAKVTPTFNRKINMYQHQDTPSSPVPTGVYVKYGLAASDTANPSPSALTFVTISDPVFILGKLPAATPLLPPTSANANASFTITAQNKDIKYLTVGVQDSLTVGGVYGPWTIMKTIANTGVAISFSEGLEAYIPDAAYSGDDVETYTTALDDALHIYLNKMYHNLNSTDDEQFFVYESDGTVLEPF